MPPRSNLACASHHMGQPLGLLQWIGSRAQTQEQHEISLFACPQLNACYQPRLEQSDAGWMDRPRGWCESVCCHEGSVCKRGTLVGDGEPGLALLACADGGREGRRDRLRALVQALQGPARSSQLCSVRPQRPQQLADAQLATPVPCTESQIVTPMTQITCSSMFSS